MGRGGIRIGPHSEERERERDREREREGERDWLTTRNTDYKDKKVVSRLPGQYADSHTRHSVCDHFVLVVPNREYFHFR